MKIKHNDIIIDSEEPFANCKLDREKYGKILTSIVSTYADGFVLAINNEWGTGKTTFVKMWEQYLKNKGFQTLYFNAWENDLGTDALAALISEMHPLVKKSNEKKFKTIIEKGAIISKHVIPKLAKAIAGKYVDIEEITSAIEGVSEGVADILEDEVKNYAKKKQGLREFRQSITSFVQDVKGDKPIVFIIDELDRCRPNYAVELLEQVKHFFSVEGIVFVLSIDKEQFGNAIRGFYGSDRINADEYLRRFIDLEYSIPHPDVRTFVIYLYQYFGFNEILLSEQRKSIRQFFHEPDAIIDLASLLFDKAHLSLRQQEKIFAHARVALRSLIWNQYLFPTVFIVLIYIKNHHPSLYRRIERKNLTVQELLDEIHNILPKGIDENSIRRIIHLEALLATFYNNYIYERGPVYTLLVKNKDDGSETATIKSRFDKNEDQIEFKNLLKPSFENREYMDLSMKLILDRINLTQTISI